ncbi:hypothetical protein [Candidatus Enterococcus clewellii]|uniref:Lipoprotein n=1 Tax=Candidatus Enterococcus clewellii TaxID=1834193 RepID=A0AAQ3VVY6_9ENTE
MKKVALTLVTIGACLTLVACGSNGNKTEKSSASTNEQSTKESTEDSATKEEEKMSKMEKDLSDKGIDYMLSSTYGYLYFTREKGIDSDCFQMRFMFSEKADEVMEVQLELKGNIDGKKKDLLYYDVNKNRIVESSYMNTDINSLADVLDSIGYSDEEILEFANWYWNSNK